MPLLSFVSDGCVSFLFINMTFITSEQSKSVSIFYRHMSRNLLQYLFVPLTRYNSLKAIMESLI